MTNKSNTKELIKIALFSALIIIGSYIIIPLFPVPISLQSLFAISSGYYLSKKYANMSVLLYIILGLIGLPVFAGGKGGMQAIFSPSFGYILGFLAQTFYIKYKKRNLSKINLFIMFMVSSIIIYAFGVAYMGIFFKLSNKQFDLWKLLFTGMIVFLPGDMLKALVFSFVTNRVEKYI
ncbi:MAG: biotin transporter BioY [Finegoldia magna]|uniref:biotin transporter BioY n=1 Tax=Finegoldia magna TaxID=1260 RepID=UPI002906159E|nr:biotin transporter BioY [Finegoldia magna]MDU5699123.1 biotin transporter BioY [Finegoldia magna]